MAHTTGNERCKGGAGPGRKTITLAQLQELCDQPHRDQPGGRDVRALLTLEPDLGFFLAARDGQEVYDVIDERGIPVCFRTVEAALTRLQDVAGLSPDIGLFIGPRSRMQH